jgi:signal transduction histidine kinase
VTRAPLFALLAIVVPATIVAGLGYVSLRQWQASAELLFREQARDMAAMAADKVEMVLRETEDALLVRLQGALGDPGTLGDALDAYVAESSLIERLYLVEQGGVLLYPRSPGDADAGVLERLLPEIAQGAGQGRRRELMVGDRILLVASVERPPRAPVVAALSWNIEVLCDAILKQTLRNLEAPTILAVLDRADRPLYSKAPLDGAERVLTVPFRERLPGWRLAIFQPPGASPRQAVRRQVALFTGAFAVLIGLIVVGVVAGYRLMRRETEMARLKSDFVANVSHDLKTPLSVIRMFGETLEMGRVTDEAKRREYYRVIARESERLSRLIENVLSFARIESGRRTYDIVPTPVEPLIRDALEVFEPTLASEGFKVEVTVAPGLPEVPLDAAAVGQALSNLVDNAIKYSDEQKWLAIDARLVGGELAIAVVDAGVGIPREEQTRIFEKFYRVGRSETQGRRGSGVGLALVRHVADAHRGRVTVESTPGHGSRFMLWLPTV